MYTDGAAGSAGTSLKRWYHDVARQGVTVPLNVRQAVSRLNGHGSCNWID